MFVDRSRCRRVRHESCSCEALKSSDHAALAPAAAGPSSTILIPIPLPHRFQFLPCPWKRVRVGVFVMGLAIMLGWGSSYRLGRLSLFATLHVWRRRVRKQRVQIPMPMTGKALLRPIP